MSPDAVQALAFANLVDMQQTRSVFAIASQLRRNWTSLNGWITGGRRSESSGTPVAAGQEKTSKKRTPATGVVEFGYIDRKGRVLRGSGKLVDRSEAGMRFWTMAQLKQGAEFLVWEPGRTEFSATVVWTKPKQGGCLVGAQIAPGARNA